MVFWVIFGIVLYIVTKLVMNKCFEPQKEKDRIRYAHFPAFQRYQRVVVSKTRTGEQVLLHVLVCLCIGIFGGMPSAVMVGMCYDVPFYGKVIIAIIMGIGTYIVAKFASIKPSVFDNKLSHLLFAVVFIISVIVWFGPADRYSTNFEKINNVDTVIWRDRKELLYFCNVPVQNVSGKIHGSSGVFSGSVDGSIETAHELTYWYVGENGNGIFATATADTSEIVFIEDGETPHVDISACRSADKIVNRNTDKEWEHTAREYTRYVFYLPKSVMGNSLS